VWTVPATGTYQFDTCSANPGVAGLIGTFTGSSVSTATETGPGPSPDLCPAGEAGSALITNTLGTGETIYLKFDGINENGSSAPRPSSRCSARSKPARRSGQCRAAASAPATANGCSPPPPQPAQAAHPPPRRIAPNPRCEPRYAQPGGVGSITHTGPALPGTLCDRLECAWLPLWFRMGRLAAGAGDDPLRAFASPQDYALVVPTPLLSGWHTCGWVAGRLPAPEAAVCLPCSHDVSLGLEQRLGRG
jgi:hypothetical protein